MFRRNFLGAIFGGMFVPFLKFQKQDELKIVDSPYFDFKASALCEVIGVYKHNQMSSQNLMKVVLKSKTFCITTDKYYFTGLFEKRLGWRLAKDLKKGDNIFVPVNLVYQEKCL